MFAADGSHQSEATIFCPAASTGVALGPSQDENVKKSMVSYNLMVGQFRRFRNFVSGGKGDKMGLGMLYVSCSVLVHKADLGQSEYPLVD